MQIRTVAALALSAAVLAGCSSASFAALEPIPGSITQTGQPRTKLTRAPAGSTFEHRFRDPAGHEYIETYRIRPDRSLEIVDRRRIDPIFGFGGWR